MPITDPLWNHIDSLSNVPPHLLKEIEHFFSIYKDLEEKKVSVKGWDGRDEALQVIREARERYWAAATA